MRLFLFVFTIFMLLIMSTKSVLAADRFFDVQAIDTMKTSRDKAREDISNEIIEKEILAIAEAGATHVAIGTPYDQEFVPYMKRWITIARKHGLKIWFRGNMAGWEGWFDYPKIDREKHKEGIKAFIIRNPELFADGDVFVSCPECENGGPGDPRHTKDVEGFRTFLREEHNIVYRAFKRIKKQVIIDYYSMNGDVAKLIMDQKTTEKLGGKVTIDHYVKTPEQLLTDVDQLAHQSGGQIVLGEWGAPIPDIHGDMTEVEQAVWIEESLKKIILNQNIIAINYWTFTDSSTQLWNSDGEPRKGALVLQKYFRPIILRGTIVDEKNKPITDAAIASTYRNTRSKNGSFTIPLAGSDDITVKKNGYSEAKLHIQTDGEDSIEKVITLTRNNKSWWEMIMEKITELLT